MTIYCVYAICPLPDTRHYTRTLRAVRGP